MTYINWRLLNATNGPLSVQPASGSPLGVKYDASGGIHLPPSGTEPSETIAVVECATDALTISVEISPDTSTLGPLDETESTPVSPTHSGRFIWQSYTENRVVLTFAVPEASGTEWTWDFGVERPPIALKMKITIRR